MKDKCVKRQYLRQTDDKERNSQDVSLSRTTTTVLTDVTF